MPDLTVYGAPWCPDCKMSKQFLSEQRIPFGWVDIDSDPEGAELVRAKNRGKQIIPTIVFADGSYLAEPTNSELAAKLGLTLRAERSYYDLLVVGGGPAGLTASIYAAREGIDALVIEKSGLGGHAGVTERIDNYPGFPEGIPGAELADRIIAQARRYEVELLPAVEVSAVSGEGGQVVVSTAGGDEYRGRAAILATGSSYRRLGVPGEDDLIGAGIHFCATCDGPFYRGAQEVMVIGGGNAAVEEGLFLTRFAEKVRLVSNTELTASALLQEKARSHPKFEIHTNADVVGFAEAGGKVDGVRVLDRVSGATEEYHPKGVFVFIGLEPNTGFLRGSVELDERGFIVTDDVFMTSMPGVYAAGDCRRGSTKQLGSAVGEGITALLMIRQYLQRTGDLAMRVMD